MASDIDYLILIESVTFSIFQTPHINYLDTVNDQ